MSAETVASFHREIGWKSSNNLHIAYGKSDCPCNELQEDVGSWWGPYSAIHFLIYSVTTSTAPTFCSAIMEMGHLQTWLRMQVSCPRFWTHDHHIHIFYCKPTSEAMGICIYSTQVCKIGHWFDIRLDYRSMTDFSLKVRKGYSKHYSSSQTV